MLPKETALARHLQQAFMDNMGACFPKLRKERFILRWDHNCTVFKDVPLAVSLTKSRKVSAANLMIIGPHKESISQWQQNRKN